MNSNKRFGETDPDSFTITPPKGGGSKRSGRKPKASDASRQGKPVSNAKERKGKAKTGVWKGKSS